MDPMSTDFVVQGRLPIPVTIRVVIPDAENVDKRIILSLDSGDYRIGLNLEEAENVSNALRAAIDYARGIR